MRLLEVFGKFGCMNCIIILGMIGRGNCSRNLVFLRVFYLLDKRLMWNREGLGGRIV